MPLIRVGGGWIKTSKSNTTYVSISLDLKKLNEVAAGTDKPYLTLFENTKKESENQPDYNLMFSKKD